MVESGSNHSISILIGGFRKYAKAKKVLSSQKKRIVALRFATVVKTFCINSLPKEYSVRYSDREKCLRGDLDALLNAVGAARVDLLASLRDGLEDLLVGQALLGDDGGGLALEGDFVRLDACIRVKLRSARVSFFQCMGNAPLCSVMYVRCLPSSLNRRDMPKSVHGA